MPGSLLEIEISDFMSFQGTVVIELIEPCQWLALTEDNSSGQSKFMDAILFALGELPSNSGPINCHDFEYKDSNGYGKTFVTLKLELVDGRIKIFRRAVENNKLKHCIDGQLVTRKEYMDCLKNGLKIEPKNMLINKNIINEIASETPKARALMFEELSGSLKFKSKYDKLKQEHDAIKLQVNTLGMISHDLTFKRENLEVSKNAVGMNCKELKTLQLEFYSFLSHILEQEIKILDTKTTNLKNDWMKKTIETLSLDTKEFSKFETEPSAKNTNNLHTHYYCKAFNIMTDKEYDEFIKVFKKKDVTNECVTLKELQAELEKGMREYLKIFLLIKGLRDIRISTCGMKVEFDIEESELNVKPGHVIEDKSQWLKKSIDEFNKVIKILSLDNAHDKKLNSKKKKELLVEKEKLILAALKSQSCVTLCKTLNNIYDDKDDEDDYKFNAVGTLNDAKTKLKKIRAKLPQHLLNITDHDEQLKILKEYNDKVSNVCNEFKSLCNVRNDLKKGKRELNYLENKSKSILKNNECINKKFDIVKNHRRQYFSAFLVQLVNNVNRFYQMLSGIEGKEVKLVFGNLQEPYLDGIQLEFEGQSMDCLDGEKKTLASLALFLALRSAKPAPFLLLDSIDNQLDEKQVSHLVECLGDLKISQQIVMTRNSWSNKVMEHADIVIFIGKDTEGDCVRPKFFVLKHGTLKI